MNPCVHSILKIFSYPAGISSSGIMPVLDISIDFYATNAISAALGNFIGTKYSLGNK